MAKQRIKWGPLPTQTDFKAALAYLTLLLPESAARRVVNRRRAVRCVHYAAKDLLRACGLDLLPADEYHVAKNIKRIRKGKTLSPAIVVQGDLLRQRPFIIADGFHRICAVCHSDEDAPVSVVLLVPDA